jgi:AcrR family transcriptional regulator
MGMTAKTKNKTSPQNPPPAPTGGAALDRERIIAHAFELARSVPLQDISIKRIAGELGVTRGSIHYHLNRREDLISAVFIRFKQELIAHWPTSSGEWRPDLEAVSMAMYRHFLRYAGISAYLVVHNRFDVLIPAIAADETGAVLGFYERLFAAVRAVGLDAKRSATYVGLLIQFIHTAAHRTAQHQWPGETEKLATYFDPLDPAEYPAIAFMRDSYAHLAGDAAFEAGLALLMAGLDRERDSGYRLARLGGSEPDLEAPPRRR